MKSDNLRLLLHRETICLRAAGLLYSADEFSESAPDAAHGDDSGRLPCPSWRCTLLEVVRPKQRPAQVSLGDRGARSW